MDLYRVEQDHHLNREGASVHEVPEEQVLGHFHGASDLKDLEEVVELAIF